MNVLSIALVTGDAHSTNRVKSSNIYIILLFWLLYKGGTKRYTRLLLRIEHKQTRKLQATKATVCLAATLAPFLNKVNIDVCFNREWHVKKCYTKWDKVSWFVLIITNSDVCCVKAVECWCWDVSCIWFCSFRARYLAWGMVVGFLKKKVQCTNIKKAKFLVQGTQTRLIDAQTYSEHTVCTKIFFLKKSFWYFYALKDRLWPERELYSRAATCFLLLCRKQEFISRILIDLTQAFLKTFIVFSYKIKTLYVILKQNYDSESKEKI